MLILGLLGMYFDGAVVFVTSQTLLFRLALAILWHVSCFHSSCQLGLRHAKKSKIQKLFHLQCREQDEAETPGLLEC